MKDFLEKIIARKKTELKAAELRFEESQDAAEVRALGETMAELREEINEAEKQLAAIDEDTNDESRAAQDDETTAQEENRDMRNANIVSSYSQAAQPQTRDVEDVRGTMEYRNAFAKYVRTGIWEYEQRDATAGMVITSDVGKIIPTTIMTEFIKELKVYGQLYSRVRKLNVKGGVEFPIEDLVPTVSWITETTVSSNQSAPELKTSVAFGYHICEARIAQSLLSSIVTLDVLESEIARLLAEAFIKAFDNAIVNGSGSGQPTGILTEAAKVSSRIPAANKIAFSAAEIADWTKWRSKFMSKIPLAYRGQGVFVMTAATWESYCLTLKDSNNNPIATETFNVVDGATVCKFAGRDVILVEPDIIDDYDTASSGEAWAIYFKPTDYAINSNLEVGFKRYFNEDTNKWVNKGLCIMDGKLLDAKGVFILKK